MTDRHKLTAQDKLSVPCSKCGARPGQRCVRTFYGSAMEHYIHVTRMLRAQMEYEPL